MNWTCENCGKSIPFVIDGYSMPDGRYVCPDCFENIFAALTARIKALTDAGNAVVTARDDMDDYASGGYFDLNTAIDALRTVLEADSV